MLKRRNGTSNAVAHLPAAGEIVLFDRSWYNRAGVERVMGFVPKNSIKNLCNPAQNLNGWRDRE